MKKIKLLAQILVVSALPTVSLAGYYHENPAKEIDVNNEAQKLGESSQPKPATAGKKAIEKDVLVVDRETLYLETIERLKAIEMINKLPATAAGQPQHSDRICSYSKSVLKEYKLELSQLAIRGNPEANKSQVEGNIKTWGQKVAEYCK